MSTKETPGITAALALILDREAEICAILDALPDRMDERNHVMKTAGLPTSSYRTIEDTVEVVIKKLRDELAKDVAQVLHPREKRRKNEGGDEE